MNDHNNSDGSYVLIKDTYIVGKRLGRGSFGEVHHGVHRWNQDLHVAIKLESLNSPHRILEHEYDIYQNIYHPNSGISRCHYYGIQGDFSVLVIDLLGDSLGNLLQLCGGKFSLKTTLMIADQMISRMQHMHDKGYIHRDIKPNNLLIGKGNQENQVFLIDFGLAKKFRTRGNTHIPFKEGNKLIGTPRYASLNSHLGHTLSRRDDMISLGYILIYFLKGKLPWQNIKGLTESEYARHDPKKAKELDREQKYINIKKQKATITSTTICRGLPSEFGDFLNRCINLKFHQRPDYEYLRTIFRRLFKRNKFQYDLVFDWMEL